MGYNIQYHIIMHRINLVSFVWTFLGQPPDLRVEKRVCAIQNCHVLVGSAFSHKPIWGDSQVSCNVCQGHGFVQSPLGIQADIGNTWKYQEITFFTFPRFISPSKMSVPFVSQVLSVACSCCLVSPSARRGRWTQPFPTACTQALKGYTIVKGSDNNDYCWWWSWWSSWS